MEGRGRDSSAKGLTKHAANAIVANTEHAKGLSRGFWLNSAGIIAIRTPEGEEVAFANGQLAVGICQPIESTHVLAATTAAVTFGF